MDKKYCKITGANNIYEIEEVKDNTVILRDKNKLIHTDIKNIQYVEKPQNRNKNLQSFNITIQDTEVENEIMLRHMTKLEALEDLDRFIDRALAHKLPRIRIIHGRHGGVIRNAVREFLDNHPNVVSYEYADYSEGGIGVTVATLGKRN